MRDVTIIGAGIAGLTAALRLSERGYRVTLLEQEDFLGGKLGAFKNKVTGDFHEHSYHFYLNWYHNFWQIIDELGIRDHFVPRTTIRYLREGEFPHTSGLKNVGSPQSIAHNLMAGVLPPAEMLIYTYSLLDLISQDFERDNFLDKISVNGFIHSRPYATAEVAQHHSRTLAKAFASHSFRTSAASYKRFIAFGFRLPEPMSWVLRGNVYDFMMKALEARLVENGCRIRRLIRVEKLILDNRGRIDRLAIARMEAPTNQSVRNETVVARGVEDVKGAVILAVPPGALNRLVDDRVFEIAPTLGQVARLRSEPMASLDLHFKRRLPKIPEDHVVLVGSPQELTFIDNSALWPDEPNTFLNVIASESDHLSGLSHEAALDTLLAELKRYVPFALEDVDYRRTHLRYNLDDQLFVNEVGTWDNRPKTTCGIDNLFIAGDFVRNHVDVVCIEGAVMSGLVSAEAVRRRAGIGDPIPCRVPETYPVVQIQALKAMLLPYVYPAKAWATAMERGKSVLETMPSPDRG